MVPPIEKVEHKEPISAASRGQEGKKADVSSRQASQRKNSGDTSDARGDG
jgi:hypothetical protein